jgi:hypothetical protein
MGSRSIVDQKLLKTHPALHPKEFYHQMKKIEKYESSFIDDDLTEDDGTTPRQESKHDKGKHENQILMFSMVTVTLMRPAIIILLVLVSQSVVELVVRAALKYAQ